MGRRLWDERVYVGHGPDSLQRYKDEVYSEPLLDGGTLVVGLATGEKDDGSARPTRTFVSVNFPGPYDYNIERHIQESGVEGPYASISGPKVAEIFGKDISGENIPLKPVPTVTQSYSYGAKPRT